MQTKDGLSRGYIAGALENGSLDLWDADKLLDRDGFVFQLFLDTVFLSDIDLEMLSYPERISIAGLSSPYNSILFVQSY